MTGVQTCALPIFSTPLEYNAKLTPLDGEPISDATRYRQFVGSLIYLTVTRLDISHAVGMAVLRILRYVKGTLYALLLSIFSRASCLFRC